MENQYKYRQISPEMAKEMIETKNNTILLDVREESDFFEYHIPKSICIPVQNLLTKSGELLTDFNQPIIVYCHSGVRSKVAIEILSSMGYTNLYDLGGIISWPYEIIKQH